MRKLTLLALLAFALGGASLSPVSQAQPARRTLDIYYVDVEGGAATLVVTPAGESILVDAGWPGFEGRDAKRIQRAMQQAGIKAIDHLIATHYHVDHYGGVPELARLVPVKRFYDHGPMPSLAEDKNFAAMYAAYREAAKNQTTTLKPGDTIQLKQARGLPRLSLLVVAAKGQVIAGRGKSPNPECAGAQLKDEDKSDNARSVAFLLRYGDFDFFDAGDLTWNVEHQLVCPSNAVGVVDLYQVTHHGMNTSNNAALVKSLKPTVAVMNNGPRKGGHPDVVKTLRDLPSLRALYQVHRNVASREDENAPAEFIANLDAESDAAHGIKVTVDAAAHTFTVTNQRTGATESYPIK
jgi:competence protein ComEC